MNFPGKTIWCLTLILLLFSVFQKSVSAKEQEGTPVSVGYTTLNGEWQRIDSNYTIKLSNVQADGTVQASYFNPRPIHIENAKISTQKDLIKLFITFQDKGYEGSTYTLYYYTEKDALAGFYYHAVLDRTYEVIFLRKND